MLQRTASGRSAYAASQQGGAPGAGLRRQADRARDEADRLAGARDRSATATVSELERNRESAAEADAKADRLESMVFDKHLDALFATNARQRRTSPNSVVGLPPPNARAAGLPDPRREAIEARLQQLEVQEQGRLRQERQARQAGGAAGQRRIEEIERESRENARLERDRRNREYEREKQQDQVLEQRGAEERARPLQSVGLCGNAVVGAGTAVKGGACIIADSRGIGFTTQQTVSAELGAGGSVSLTAQASSAPLKDLGGPSAFVSGSTVVGGGVEGSAGLSADGKNNWTVSAGPAIGARASAGVGLQQTQSEYPQLSWADVAELLLWRNPATLFR